jgi:hypothetical protein
MLRAVLLFGFLTFFWLVASSAEACSYPVPRNPGETEAHAYERLRRVNQDRYWVKADTVFVGEVVGLHQGARDIKVSILPRVSFKGNAGAAVVTYDLDERHGREMSCGRAAFPEFRTVGLFYASRENDRLSVRDMLGPNDIRDDALRARTINQLTPFEVTDLAMKDPPQNRGPLLLTCLLAFCTFIAGLAFGRVWRSGSKRMTP